MPWSNSVSAELWIRAGSRYEAKRESGISHFLEHMLFEGTKKFKNNQALRTSTESFGGDLSAYTGKEYVAYTTKFPNKHQTKGLDFLYEIIFNSLFRKSDIKKEKGIVLEELNRSIDNPEAHSWDLINNFIWPNYYPLNHMVLGNKEDILALNQKRLLSFKNNFYTPENMILTIAGKFNKNLILKKIESSFGKLETKNSPAIPQNINFDFFDKKFRVLIEEKKSSKQTLISIFFLSGINPKHKDIATLMILNRILSLAVFDELVYKLGLAYSAYSSFSYKSDHSTVCIRAGVSHSNIDKTINIILDKIKKLKINEQTINKTKNNFKKNSFLDLSDSNHFSDFIAEQAFFFDKVMSPEEVKKEIDKVNQKNLIRVKNSLLNYKNCGLLILGQYNKKKISSLDRILSNKLS